MNVLSSIIVCAPAKINLFLHVVGKREDGYHLLDSLVVFTECGDLIEVEISDRISLEIEGRFAASLANTLQEENLVWKAATALQKYARSNQGAHIRLTKNLPIGSGIGGGSADAAATICALLKLWKLDISEEKLFEIALSLGSDVPVCLYGKPALMRGIGEELLSVTLQEKIYMVLINPNIPLATKDVFRAFNNSSLRAEGEAIHKRKDWIAKFFLTRLTATLPRNDGLSDTNFFLTEITDEMGYANDLEFAATQKLPIIGEIIVALRSTQSCFLARMSGSGATCFGLYYDEAAADSAAKELQRIFPQAWCEVTQNLRGLHGKT